MPGKLHEFVLTQCQSACTPPVNFTPRVRIDLGTNTPPGSIVFDVEGCLPALYGGFYPDWATGGQWNKFFEVMATVARQIHRGFLQCVFFIDGTFAPDRFSSWVKQQTLYLTNLSNIVEYVNSKALHPPKIWWIPPVGIHTCIRFAAHQMGVSVRASNVDHVRELVTFCRDNSFDAVLTSSEDLMVFGPKPRLFLGHSFKVAHGQFLLAEELILDDVARYINLDPDRFYVLASLLGSYMFILLLISSFFVFVTCLFSVYRTNDFT